jgi:hypothetical protein
MIGSTRTRAGGQISGDRFYEKHARIAMDQGNGYVGSGEKADRSTRLNGSQQGLAHIR